MIHRGRIEKNRGGGSLGWVLAQKPVAGGHDFSSRAF